MFSNYSKSWRSTKYLCGVRGAWISVDKGETERGKLGNLLKLPVCKRIPSPAAVWRKYSRPGALHAFRSWGGSFWSRCTECHELPFLLWGKQGEWVSLCSVCTLCLYEANRDCYCRVFRKQKEGESWKNLYFFKVGKIFVFAFADLFNGKNYQTHPFLPFPSFLFQVILDTASWISEQMFSFL